MQKGVPQIMDITSIKSILHCLSNEILPSRFEIAQQPEPNTIQIGFRGIKNLCWIEVSWQSDCARIIKINKPDKIGSQSTLAKQLTYGLKYMALVDIQQDKFERVITFKFAKKPSDEITKYLIFELMGKHSNIFYLDKSLKIIAVGKQVKSSQSSFRTISTGDLYTQPPNNFKKEPNEKETYNEWKNFLLSFPDSLEKSLIKNYQGVSPILTKQIEFISNKKNIMKQNIALVDENNLKEIFNYWKQWIINFNQNHFNFVIFDEYFYCVWFTKSENTNTKQITLPEGLNNYYDHHLKLKKIEIIADKIERTIFKQETIEKKNLNYQKELLKNAQNHKDLKTEADNIFLNINLQKENIIEAEKLYKKSKKLKRAKNLIMQRVEIYRNKVKRLDEFKTMLDNLSSCTVSSLKIKIKLLEELKEELCNEFNVYLKTSKAQKRNTGKGDSFPMQLKSPSGLIIHAGRNMRQNDLISFKLSNKKDLWFHAQESPGSHVLLKSSTQLPTDDDIQVTADIAAFFCRAKGNIKVPVNMVEIKNLQKVKSAGLGCVTFNNSEIIWGSPTRGKDYIKKNTQSEI